MMRKKQAQEVDFDDLEMLEELQKEFLQKLRDNDYEPKVADLLRLLDMKTKLKLSDDGKRKFWELIDQIRREELARKNKKDN